MQLSLLGGSFQLVISKWLVNLVTCHEKAIWNQVHSPDPLGYPYDSPCLKTPQLMSVLGGHGSSTKWEGFHPHPRPQTEPPKLHPAPPSTLPWTALERWRKKAAGHPPFCSPHTLEPGFQGGGCWVGVNGLGLGVKSSNL